MVRSGKLLVILLCAAGLTACTLPAQGDPAPTPTTADAACPPGLPEALVNHYTPIAVGDRVPESVVVTEFPEQYAFSSDLVAEMSDCILSIETFFAGGDRMVQLFGITDGLDESEVVARLDAAGWEQPFPETEPGVWRDPATQEDVGIDPQRTADPSGATFPDWDDYLEADEVLLLGAVGI